MPDSLDLVFNGRLRDRIGPGSLGLRSNGIFDATFTVTLHAPGGRQIVACRLEADHPPVTGIWDTDGPGTPDIYVLGVARTFDDVLLNNATTMAVNFFVNDGASFALFAEDDSFDVVPPRTLTLTVTFSDLTTLTVALVIPVTKATLTPSATDGTNILFTCSESRFIAGDVGRIIVFEASRAVITALEGGGSPNNKVRADILDEFPNTNTILGGDWFLRLSPQATLDPNKKSPIGTSIVLVAGKSAFRTNDDGKFIKILGGLVEITSIDSATQVTGVIRRELQASVDDPPAVPAGAWSLEVASWSPRFGFPRTGEFIQGRLAEASTAGQPTTFWMSSPDNFDDFATGIKADDAVEYTIASRMINRLEWIVENADPSTNIRTTMYLGGTNAEFFVSSGKPNEPFGGDIIPLVDKSSDEGSAPVQAVTVGNKVLFLDRSRRKLFLISYNPLDDAHVPIEITAPAEHITTAGGIRLGPIGVQKRPDRRFYFVTSGGQLVVLTYLPNEKVIGFSRFITDGFFEAVACVTNNVTKGDIVYVIVQRSINNQMRRYIEIFDEDISNTTRPWTSLQSDCAVFRSGRATSLEIGLEHLEGKTVDIIGDGSYRGTKVVTGGVLQYDEEYKEREVGLHYTSRLRTMRPSIPNVTIEGLPRHWSQLWVRLHKSLGGRINGEDIIYPPGALDTVLLFTGDRQITPRGISGSDTDGSINIVQDEPYPFTVLCTFGTLNIGDND